MLSFHGQQNPEAEGLQKITLWPEMGSSFVNMGAGSQSNIHNSDKLGKGPF